MKNLLTTKAAAILLGIVFLLNQPLIASEVDKHCGGVKDSKNSFPALEEKTTFKIYDQKDNLVYETTIDSGDCPEEKLVKYLHHSDLLIEFKKQKIYRLS